jgi:hypothetical protein
MLTMLRRNTRFLSRVNIMERGGREREINKGKKVSVVLFPSVYNILNMRVVTSFHMV